MRSLTLTQRLLLANVVTMLLVTWVLLEYVNNNMQLKMNEKTGWPNDLPATVTAKTHDVGHATTTTTKPTKSAPGGTSTNNGQIGTTNAAGFYFVTPKDGERNFYDLGVATSTDKVTVPRVLPGCLEDDSSCTRPSCVRPECRAWGHHYDTLYQQRLGPYSREDVAPFQFLEIGFYNGAGYDLYREFLPRGECHSMEIACIEEGPVEEGKWPWGNFAAKNPRYQQYLDEGLLHCGDANDVVFLDKIWREKMNRDDAPPLRIVVDDGAHLAEHMVQTLFYWFPKIQPRGLLIVEDIQPIQEANAFRTQFLPQIMKDLHFCGDPKEKKDDLCFPTISLLLASIHCEMHICIFERNDKPAKELTLEESKSPDNALDMSKCKSKVHGHW